jgi:hypothetical protein
VIPDVSEEVSSERNCEEQNLCALVKVDEMVY